MTESGGEHTFPEGKQERRGLDERSQRAEGEPEGKERPGHRVGPGLGCRVGRVCVL